MFFENSLEKLSTVSEIRVRSHSMKILPFHREGKKKQCKFVRMFLKSAFERRCGRLLTIVYRF